MGVFLNLSVHEVVGTRMNMLVSRFGNLEHGRIGGLDLGGGGTPPLPNKIWDGGALRSGTV